MTLSMYQTSVPVFVRALGALSDILDKAEAFVKEQGLDEQAVLDLRLAPDMFALARQVQIASDAAKGGVARLAGVESPGFPDTETSFAELRHRIAKTIAFVQSVPAELIDGSQDRAIIVQAGPTELTFTGRSFLLDFALPNLFFHISTAYGLLRQAGVRIGKSDYLGGARALQ